MEKKKIDTNLAKFIKQKIRWTQSLEAGSTITNFIEARFLGHSMNNRVLLWYDVSVPPKFKMKSNPKVVLRGGASQE